MPTSNKKYKDATVLAEEGRDSKKFDGAVNTPVYHASTVLFSTVDELWKSSGKKISYGRHGMPTHFALQDMASALEGGGTSVLVPSGLCACTLALLSFLSQGDHVLVTDGVYGPTRKFCDTTLRRLGIEVEYYDSALGKDIARHFRPNTKVVYLESPSSLTFEFQDVPAIAKVAHEKGALVLMDNTWATPLFFKPFDYGVDVSIISATKYYVGHADAMMGIVTAKGTPARRVAECRRSLGLSVGPDDVYATLRGLRTLETRLHRHQSNALELARWLKKRPEVSKVLHPALKTTPGHKIWARDFKGASGLFAVVLKPVSTKALKALLEKLSLFGMGYSWGGYESLVVPYKPQQIQRTVTPWTCSDILLRFHAGLESVDDLKEDLQAGFARMAKVAGKK